MASKKKQKLFRSDGTRANQSGSSSDSSSCDEMVSFQGKLVYSDRPVNRASQTMVKKFLQDAPSRHKSSDLFDLNNAPNGTTLGEGRISSSASFRALPQVMSSSMSMKDNNVASKKKQKLYRFGGMKANQSGSSSGSSSCDEMVSFQGKLVYSDSKLANRSNRTCQVGSGINQDRGSSSSSTSNNFASQTMVKKFLQDAPSRHKSSDLFDLNNAPNGTTLGEGRISSSASFRALPQVMSSSMSMEDINASNKEINNAAAQTKSKRRKVSSVVSSVFFGVSLKTKNQWQANLSYSGDKPTKYLGLFDKQEDAARVFDVEWDKANKAGQKPHGALNFPNELEKSKKVLPHHEKKKKDRKTSRYIGVSWHKSSLRWKATIRIRGVQENLGYFHDQEEAARAYDARNIQLGRTTKLNFPLQ